MPAFLFLTNVTYSMDILLKKGDIVCDFEESTWGSQKFIIDQFFGNNYCFMISTHKIGMNNRGAIVNILAHHARLVDAPNRPFRNTDIKVLLKLIQRGIVEAKRELKMRNNTKKIFYGKQKNMETKVTKRRRSSL